MNNQSEHVKLPKTHEEGVEAMRDWVDNNREPLIDELLAAYLICWPAMQKCRYNHSSIPGGKTILAAMNEKRFARLLLYLKENPDHNLLFCSLDLPLKVTNGSRTGLIAAQCAYQILWPKRRILECFELGEGEPKLDFNYTIFSLDSLLDRSLASDFEALDYRTGSNNCVNKKHKGDFTSSNNGNDIESDEHNRITQAARQAEIRKLKSIFDSYRAQARASLESLISAAEEDVDRERSRDNGNDETSLGKTGLETEK